MANLEKIDLDNYKADTTGWSDYCMGYNTLMLPPGMIAYWSAATHVDFHYPEVARNYPGTAMDYIKSHRLYGGSTFSTKVNGWDFVIAKERLTDTMISDESLNFFGATKVGRDVILFSEPASTDRVGDGTDPKYRAFYERLTAEPVTKRNRRKGFCYDGYVFSGYTPKLKYEFSAGFKSTTNPDRHRYRVNLSQKMKRPPRSDRPLAPQNERSGALFNEYFDVDYARLNKFGNVGILTHGAGKKDDASGKHFLEALTETPYGDLKHPVIYIEVVENVRPMSYEDGRKEFLGVLSSIQPN